MGKRKHHKSQIPSSGKPPTSPSAVSIWALKLPNIHSFVAALLLGFGFPIMTSGSGWAPWFISFGFFAIATIAVNDTHFRNWLTRRIKSQKWRLVLYLTLCLISFTLPFTLTQIETNKQREIQENIPKQFGYLTPDHLRTPALPSNKFSPSEIGTDAITLMLGDDSGVFVEGETIVISHSDKPIISINKDLKGRINLTADVFNVANNRVVKIINNEFQTDIKYAFLPKQPDAHTLMVRDIETGEEVLNVHYINSKLFELLGAFLCLIRLRQ